MPDFENPGVVSVDERVVSPEVARRKEQIRVFAAQAQNAFVVAVEKFQNGGAEQYELSDHWTVWNGDATPMLGIFLHVCREALDGLGLHDISTDALVRVGNHLPGWEREAIAAGRAPEREFDSLGERLDVSFNGHVIYYVLQDGEWAPEICADSEGTPKEYRTENDLRFDRLEFECALAELLDAHPV